MVSLPPVGSPQEPVVCKLFQSLVMSAVTWRQGVSAPLGSRFARVRVRAAHPDRLRAEEWLLIEWPRDANEPDRTP